MGIATTTLPGEPTELEEPVEDITPLVPPQIEEPIDGILEAPEQQPTQFFETGLEPEPEEEPSIEEMRAALNSEFGGQSAEQPQETGDPEVDKMRAALANEGSTITLRKAVQILNAGISDLLDLPGDVAAGIVNGINSALGLDEIMAKIPSGGFRRMFDIIGSTLPEEKIPDTVLAHALRFLGQSIAGLPFAASLGIVKQGAVTGQGALTTLREGGKTLAHTIGQTAVRKPISFTAAELIAGGGAGTGFGIVKQSTDDPTALLLGGLAGGISPAVTVGLIKSFGFKGFQILNDARLSFTKSKGDPRAAKRLDVITTNKEKALDAIAGEGDEVLPEFRQAATPAQLSQDPGLLRLERAVLEGDDLLKPLQGAQHAELNEIIIRSMSEATEGQFALTREELRAQKLYLQALVNERMRLAELRAQQRIADAGADLDPVAANKIAREELESALEDALVTQRELWGQVGKDVSVASEPLQKIWREILSRRTGLADKGDLKFTDSEGATDLLTLLGHIDADGNFVAGSIKKNISIAELQDLRSRLLEQTRGDLGRRNSSRKRGIFNKLQNTIMKMFETMEGETIMVKNADGVWEEAQPSKQLTKAIAFSRNVNEKFNRSEIRHVLGSNPDGSLKVDPEMTLHKLLGKGVSPPQRALNLKKLMKAVERETKATNRIGVEDDPLNTAPVTHAVKAYIKHQFIRNFVFDGEVTRKSATQWINDNRETLKQIPGLADELKSAIKSGSAAELMVSRDAKVQALLNDPNRSALVRFIEQEPLDALTKTAKGTVKQAETDIGVIIRKAAKDPSGEATLGLQQSVFDWILERSMLTGSGKQSVDAFDRTYISGFKMTEFLKIPSVRAIINKALTPEQLSRLEVIRKTAKQLDAIRKSESTIDGEIIKDAPGWILDLVGKVAGADIGRRVSKQLGGGTIQTPGAFSQRMRIMLKSLVKDHGKQALIDALTAKSPDRLKALLMVAKTPAEKAFQNRQLNAYLMEVMDRHNLKAPEEDFYGDIDDESDVVIEMEQGSQ